VPKKASKENCLPLVSSSLSLDPAPGARGSINPQPSPDPIHQAEGHSVAIRISPHAETIDLGASEALNLAW
jgi:hypothetical protein